MSNAYDSPLEITYSIGVLLDMGTAGPADGTYSIKGPTGMKGRILDWGISVIEVFACDTTEAKWNLGKTAGAAEYLAVSVADGTAAGDHYGPSDDTSAVKTVSNATNIPANQQVEVTVDVGVDSSTQTGTGWGHVTIGWYN